jgi:hypothetical protein
VNGKKIFERRAKFSEFLSGPPRAFTKPQNYIGAATMDQRIKIKSSANERIGMFRKMIKKV